MNPVNQTSESDTSPAPTISDKLASLRHQVEVVKAASLFHKAAETEKAVDIVVDLLADMAASISAIESFLARASNGEFSNG